MLLATAGLAWVLGWEWLGAAATAASATSCTITPLSSSLSLGPAALGFIVAGFLLGVAIWHAGGLQALEEQLGHPGEAASSAGRAADWVPTCTMPHARSSCLFDSPPHTWPCLPSPLQSRMWCRRHPRRRRAKPLLLLRPKGERRQRPCECALLHSRSTVLDTLLAVAAGGCCLHPGATLALSTCASFWSSLLAAVRCRLGDSHRQQQFNGGAPYAQLAVAALCV